MSVDANGLFFIVGTGRCGTTLLQAMLASHSRIAIPPELRYFGRHDPIAAFRDPLPDRMVERYLRRCKQDIWWQDMGLDFDAFAASVRNGLRSGRDIFLWVLNHVCARRGTDKPRIGEKTPFHGLLSDRILALFPDAKFVHIYRDPRDVTASYMSQYWCVDRTGFQCAGFINYFWKHMRQLQRRIGDRQFIEVRYEALVRDPERELRRLCDFLGEAFEPAMLRYAERQDPGFLPVEEVWKGKTRLPISPGYIGRFGEQLTPRQIWTVDHRVGPLLEAFGYARASEPVAPMSWRVRYTAERIQRKILRTLRLQRNLLDERRVLARRNELLTRGAGI